MADLSKLTDEEIEEILEDKLKQLMAQEKTVAPMGATGGPGTFSRASAIGQGAGNALTVGAYPALNAITDVGFDSIAKGADLLTDAVGLEGLIPPQETPSLMGSYNERLQGREQIQEQHPALYGTGEIAGFLGGPVNRTAGALIQQVPTTLGRIGATAGVAAGEEAAYRYNMGDNPDDVMDAALTAGGFGAGIQGAMEGGNAIRWRFGGGKAAGMARAMNDIFKHLVSSGEMTAEQAARRAKELGAGATIGDIAPETIGAAPVSHAPLAEIPNYVRFVRDRQKLLPQDITSRVGQEFQELPLTPGQTKRGIKAYRQSLQPQYDALLTAMDNTTALKPGRQLRDEFEALMTTSPTTGRTRLGAHTEGFRDVEKVVKDFATQKLGVDTVAELKEDAITAARQAAEDAGLTGRDLTQAVAAARREFNPIDHVEFTPSELHDLKIKLDSLIGSKAPEGSNPKIRRKAFIEARNHVNAALGELDPEYAVLNSKFAGSHTAEEAYEYGRKLLTSKDDIMDVATDIAEDMSPGDIPFLMEGLRSAMSNKVGDVADLKKLMTQPNFQEKLTIAMGGQEDVANKFIADMNGLLDQLGAVTHVGKQMDAATKKAFLSSQGAIFGATVDNLTMGAIVSNAMAGGRYTPQMGSGASMGALRRIGNKMTGVDVAKGGALADIAQLPAAELSKIINSLPASSALSARGRPGEAAALAELTGPQITDEDLMAYGQMSVEQLRDLLLMASE